jgi:hypothetical protein
VNKEVLPALKEEEYKHRTPQKDGREEKWERREGDEEGKKGSTVEEDGDDEQEDEGSSTVLCVHFLIDYGGIPIEKSRKESTVKQWSQDDERGREQRFK